VHVLGPASLAVRKSGVLRIGIHKSFNRHIANLLSRIRAALSFFRIGMASNAAGKGLLLQADPIAATFREEVKASLTKVQRPPRLVGILSTGSAPSKSYAEFTKKQCEALGFDFQLKFTGRAESDDKADGEGVEEAIIEANEDDNVDGIMVLSANVALERVLTSTRSIIRFLESNRFVSASHLC
jgi:hypothetical protein